MIENRIAYLHVTTPWFPNPYDRPYKYSTVLSSRGVSIQLLSGVFGDISPAPCGDVTPHRGAPALDLSSSHPVAAVEGVAGQRLGGAAATAVRLHRQLVHSGDVFSSQIK
jgi:hypothetical protein